MSTRYVKSLDGSGLIVYDFVERCVVRYLSEWAHEKGAGWRALTAAMRSDHVLRFLEYLNAQGMSMTTVTDALLREFRDAEVQCVLDNPRSNGLERRAQETVNDKLRTIYALLEWMQHKELLPPDWVGPTSRSAVRIERVVQARGNRVASRYPLVFPLTGVRSTHTRRLHVPRARFDEAVHLLASQPNAYLAARDSLLLDIADQVGLRRASINSLSVRQFPSKMLESVADATVSISPARQKFGYHNEFDFPVVLALRVVQFIQEERESLLRSLGAGARKRAGDSIFLSCKSARPLTDRAISQIASRAFRAVGCAKGVAVHAGRRLFAVESVEQEIEERLRQNLDTSTASICAAVALKLGHGNPASLHPYVVAALSRKAANDRHSRSKR
jgi:hypothetical protein